MREPRDLLSVINEMSKARDLVEAGFLAAHGLSAREHTNAFASLMSVISHRLEELEEDLERLARARAA